MEKIIRCHWCESHPLLVHYHDAEWGLPSRNDQHLYEHIVLEIFQAGLNWLTMLKKRENFRVAFAGFNPEKVAKFGPIEYQSLLNNPGIIRNQAKIKSAINNAGAFLKIRDEFAGFANFLAQFRPEKAIVYTLEKDIPVRTPEAEALAKEMKARGFSFIGPTSAYAYMQGVGLVNDHIESCFRFKDIKSLQKFAFYKNIS
jgi:DNA-3-methyladenine glycosylase I